MSSVSVPPSRSVIAVFGVTGQQGGAVFRALIASNQFHVRGITRTPQSESAQKLLASVNHSHAELVSGDLNNAESLDKAFAGAWGAFVMTQFWDANVGAKEEQQAKAAADAALKAGVKVFVYSSLSDAHTISGGRRVVPHFTGKNRAEQYIRSLPFAESVAFPYAGCFASNFLSIMKPKKNDKDGVYEFQSIVRSDVALPVVDIEEEYGATVVEIFRHPKKYDHQSIFTGTYYTYPQIVSAFIKGTGQAGRYVQLSVKAGKAFGVSEEQKEALEFINDNGYYGGANVHAVAKPTDAAEFFRKHAKQF